MNHEALDGMDQMSQWVATMTGVKQQLLDAGWSNDIAEQMTLEALRFSSAQTLTQSGSPTTPPARIPTELPDSNYRSPNFNYGNWRGPHTYVCSPCDAEGDTRPPSGLIEWMEEDGELHGDFVPVCYTHMHEQEARWWARFETSHEDAS